MKQILCTLSLFSILGCAGYGHKSHYHHKHGPDCAKMGGKCAEGETKAKCNCKSDGETAEKKTEPCPAGCSGH